MVERKTKFPGIESLTMNDIVTWAGHKITSRGQGYQRDGMVADISITAEGILLADVHGSDLYSVMVSAEEGGLPQSVCSCPYGINCKHGVAALLEYIERLNNGQSIQSASSDDPRLQPRERNCDDDEPYPQMSRRQNRQPDSMPSVAASNERAPIEEYLSGLNKKQLVSKILRLSEDILQVQSCLREEIANLQADHAALLKNLHREIQRVSRIDAWSDPWSGGGNIPDYSGVRQKMRTLLDSGNFDGLLAEGVDFFQLAKEQIKRSNDEGETCEEIAHCVPLLLEALRASGLPALDKLLWALEAILEDDYGICDGLKEFLEETHAPEAWSLAANSLAARLKKMPSSEKEFMVQFQRNLVSDWLIFALERSGREKEIIPLCEVEAKAAGDYKRLVARLIRDGRDVEALQWIREGVAKTKDHAYGHTRALRDCQRAIYKKRGDWQSLVSLAVEDFMHKPAADTFAQCREAANLGGIWPELRRTLLDFLVSATMPWKHQDWPADLRKRDTETGKKRVGPDFPMLLTLIEIAIQEKLPEEVAHWYAMLPGTYDNNSFHNAAAAAMREKFPERSITIWKRLAETSISLAKKNAYQEAGGYLRTIRKLMCDQELEEEWLRYITSLRTQHFRKKRFLEILDSMDEKPLLKS